MIRTRRIHGILLILLITAVCALCEGADGIRPVTPLDGSDTSLFSLPLNDYTVCGELPDENGFSVTGYSDPSIEVRMYHEWVEDTCFNVASVRVADASQLRTALSRNSIGHNNYVSAIARKNNAVVAVGGEYLASNKGTYTVRMGNTLRKKGYRTRDTLITDQNGDFHVLIGYSDEKREELERQGIRIINLFNFGPALIIDGEPKYRQGDSLKYPVGYPHTLQPRTAIGQTGPLEYLLVMVDGRGVKSPTPDGGTKASAGCNALTLTEFMLSKGCTQAYMLDGGGSAAMYFHDGVYSKPSSKRGVTDIVYFATLMPGIGGE